ncbi:MULTISPECIES: DUF4926 domain-containing protein [Synechocystis]|uniref:DUF4926 domain-containing protein n=1 Tax=Synechocystis salina LEGE 00031 TaxID=1828736 RepID=A0ABR9VS50_9SYNC|nr:MULTISPECIES: DUF4926 domain-containing protein [Synechocystis]MBD2653972.1 DUF4926 domain-containing protein [Synechocystis sp. FACHB-383]MBE9195009.1 DUF4926 domain-containing protein [Synechocystis sp. LEGE 06083]MBE9240075.1 DUF4926 domain-containing protein [Synechocystis salina LEGE 00041]MBE9253298.1 DUF4926 domain-containing protein [Synechocystis salina LEGE 00031]
MNLELYQRVVLTVDQPQYNLKKGDIATLVDMVPHPAGRENGYILEVFNAKGESIAVISLPQSQVEPIPDNALLSVRLLAA